MRPGAIAVPKEERVADPLIRVAARLEKMMPWADERPPVHGSL